MIEINWNLFKAKFNGKENDSFELLSYLLFLREFNKERVGIFRYFNQAGNETEPIYVDGEWIGFQAKFYDTKIFENKTKIENSIKTAKEKNPNQTKMYFYLNQEFSEGKKKKKPQYQIDIEDFAKSKGVKIEWRVRSHFQAQLSLDENKSIGQYFFSLDKGVIDFIVELNNHTSNILFPIHSEIEFNEKEIKIDRSKILDNFKAALENSTTIILSGEGGVGKTALIKDFYNSIEKTIPFFIFKAIEFNKITYINDFFQKYGNGTSEDFIKEFEDIQEKYIVIDSAEKLSDLENAETFQEFLSILIHNNWKIIFTTRHSYLDDLKYQLVEIYRLNFKLFDIEKLSAVDLESISTAYNFSLPKDERFLELLKIPFYLNEYLQNYKSIEENFNYSEFKKLLWNKQILKSSIRKDNIHLKREKCFLNIAKKRADSGYFFVNVDECNESALKVLSEDEIIQHDAATDGYFITHDIYEEWALDTFIERSFLNRENYTDFFDLLGSSLPIRRAFRNWLSEKLLINRDEIRDLIESSFLNDKLEKFWKDEILVSVLLSDYSDIFFQMFERLILEDNLKLLYRIIFLLRIACKENDEQLITSLGLSKEDATKFLGSYTKPKGNGWKSIIEFIHKHVNKIDISKLNQVIPLLDEWTKSIKRGKATKSASQIALYYLNVIDKEKYSYKFKDSKKKLIEIILHGGIETKDELDIIFNEVISKKQKDNTTQYYDLIQKILSSAFTSLEMAIIHPDKVIKLAELFWYQSIEEKLENKKQRMEFGYVSNEQWEIEDYFCISKNHREYYPASAYQTPIYQLLRFSPKATIDFILSFTNKTVECYAKSQYADQIEQVDVHLNDNEIIKQYLDTRLWNTYRGTQSAPELLESIHMALEKYLLEYAKDVSKEALENLCFYLIKNSISASISAIVVSIVLAHPYRLFNLAKMIFKTKEFILQDTKRMSLDRNAKNLFSIGFGLDNKTFPFQQERIKTCDESHRRSSLELLALTYQVVTFENDTEQSLKEKQEILWEIFDKYYSELSDDSNQHYMNEWWRFSLAKMDYRKMNLSYEQKDVGVLIKFNPDLDNDLIKSREQSLKQISDSMKYHELEIWAENRFWMNDKYKEYEKYEANIKLVISEVKEIIDGIKNEREFYYSQYYGATPSYACAVLLRDFFDILDHKEKLFCKKTINYFAFRYIAPQKYHYGLHNIDEPIMATLPLILTKFSKEKVKIKTFFFHSLIDYSQGNKRKFVINAIRNSLWKLSFDDAQSLFLGYLLLKPKYNDLRNELNRKHREEFQYSHFPDDEVLRQFLLNNQSDFDKVIANNIKFEDFESIRSLDLDSLVNAFSMLPNQIDNIHHKYFVKIISQIFSEKLFIRDHQNKVDYNIRNKFFTKFSFIVLNSSKEEALKYVKPFIDNFSVSESTAEFFCAFVTAEDELNQNENFWNIWNLFYDKIVEICVNSNRHHHTKEILHKYLLGLYWKEDANNWRSLRNSERIFFKKLSDEIGHYPPVLYSLAKFLNEIGNVFLNDGITWISNILQNNKNLVFEDLEDYTVYYLEKLIKQYISTNRRKIKITRQLKNHTLTILDFLVEKGSVTGYLLRESIL